MPTIDNRLPTEGTQQDILNAILQIVSTLTVDDNGHVIVNDSGTFLAQRNNLKIGGVYTEDVSGDDTTVANVIRKMTKEQLLSLQGEAKKGIQITTDEPSVLPLTTDWVEAKGGNTSTQLLDNMNNSIAPAEYGTKSVSNYSVNDVFMLNGIRVVATSAISQGDTFVVYPATGYNCQPQTVEEKIDNVESRLPGSKTLLINKTTAASETYNINIDEYNELYVELRYYRTPFSTITYKDLHNGTYRIYGFVDATTNFASATISVTGTSSGKVITACAIQNYVGNVTSIAVYGIKY